MSTATKKPASPPTWRMPAEWEPHEGTWLAWPHEKSDWPGKFAPIPFFYARLIAKLTRFEKVFLVCRNETEAKQARTLCAREHADLSALVVYLAPTDRSWLRDTAPIFIKSRKGEVAITDWHFNAWAKYDNWANDDQLPGRVAAWQQLATTQPMVRGKRVVLEGGSIEVNGTGSLLTTEECLLSPIQARNPHLQRAEIEKALCTHLGVRNVLWLDRGITGDDTHGHVDDLARFVNQNTVVVASESNSSDENYEPLRDAYARLKSMRDEEGNPLRVVKLPMPRPIFYDGQRLPASYANFYIANFQVLVPTFNDPNDLTALQILSRLFPNHEVCGLDCSELILGLGTLHCMSQQQPAAGL